MYLILTRSFPPEVGGMQNLMWGLANSLSKYFMIKVFADYYDQHESYDKEVSFNIERIGGIKLLRKYRKAHLVNEFIKNKLNECFIFPLSGGVIVQSKTIPLHKSILNIIDRLDTILINIFPDVFALGRSVVLQKSQK